ncbi:MAG TPA: HAD-IIIA family hydrolase [Nitrospirae bacterium]|nr:HAD-IIIA family hydrolase [Nitrospirota bacterium]HDK17434.1 HAD-IIIA family hydrolase [Nitrospirota bacterium]HDK81301.1 HAD-IIIA family hydrolase [Nitrospirota bacterium]HDO25330.1 HAD-IIIA family hydrolase [Nitrospirota bacterium]
MIEKAKKIKLVIFDVDGVLTDGSIILDKNGNELKRFNVRDGHGIKALQKAGIKVALITGRESPVVKVRAEELGIEEVHQKIFKKSSVYETLLEKYKLTNEEVAFMGDDIVDAELLKRVGLPAVPADADEGARKLALFVSTKAGGRGAVREFVELILKSSGLWDSVSGETLG